MAAAPDAYRVRGVGSVQCGGAARSERALRAAVTITIITKIKIYVTDYRPASRAQANRIVVYYM